MSGFLLFSVLTTIVQLLFPIFLNVTAFADVNAKKLYFSLYILRIFKVYGGYATLYGEGIAFHLTKNRAALLPYSEMLNARNAFEFKITRGFFLYAFSAVSEIGAKTRPAAAVLAAALLQIAGAVGAGTVGKRKLCNSFKNDVILYPESDCVKLNVRIIFMFNFLAVILAASKIILQTIVGKINENKHIRTKQKSQ